MNICLFKKGYQSFIKLNQIAETTFPPKLVENSQKVESWNLEKYLQKTHKSQKVLELYRKNKKLNSAELNQKQSKGLIPNKFRNFGRYFKENKNIEKQDERDNFCVTNYVLCCESDIKWLKFNSQP